jgi:hypothetical protein
VFAALILVLFATAAAAQAPAIIDPRIVEFDPSPDHSALNASGQPRVTRYDLELYLVDGTQPVQVVNLNKPAPQGDGKIRVDFTTLLNPWPAAGTIYEARVAAVGPGGTGRSTESNTFSFSSPCSSAISPTSVSVNGQASNGTVAVTAVAGCAWSATSNSSWLTVTSGAAGAGNGTVGYSVAANGSTSQRTGSLSIAGQTFSVTQSGGCTYTIAPSATSVSASATSGTVSVSSAAGCPWTAQSTASWITVTSGASGSGNGTVGYSVTANTTTSQRSGSVTIGGRTFTITQDAAACTYTVSPVNATLSSVAGSATVNVTSANGCAWTASTSTSWITVTGGSSGSGNGQVTYSVTANPNTTDRTGTITIAGQTFTVTQTGRPCTFAISPVSTSVPAAAGSSTVSVDTLTGCSWNATSNASWLSITAGSSGSGDGTVSFNIGANSSLNARSGTLTVGGQTFTVNQAGVVCTSTIAPVSANVGASGTQGTVNVTMPASACTWTASNGGVSWITITSGSSGQGNGSVGYTVAANTSTSSRSANLTIAGKTFGVSQAGITCSYTVAPLTASAVAAGGTGSVTVTSAAGCAWQASSAVSWMSITGGTSGSGTGPVSYSVAANPTTQSRQGVLTVAGQAVTVTQAAGCGYNISPASASVTAAAGSGNVNVTAGSGCAWSASSPASWITFSTPTSGSGNGSVGYSVQANPNSSSRSATITVASQPFVITQAGATCDATLNPTAQSVAAGGASFSTNVTLPGGCAWTAVPSVSWITVTNGASGSGNGTVSYSVSANPAGTSRSGTIAIGGDLLSVTQAGAACSATLSSTSEAFEAVGGSRVVSVTIPTGCLWTAASNASWITVTSGAGPNTSGNGAVTFLVAANTSTSPRQGTLTISGRTLTVDQAGTCDITISPNSVSAASDASTGSVSVTTGGTCSWSATSSAAWLTITSGTSGVGAGTVAYSAAANTTTGSRSATLTIGGRVFSLTQAAPACAATLSTTSVSLTSSATFRTVQVTIGGSCGWTAASSVPWITIASGGSGTGPGTVSYNVAANTSTASRTGTLTISGETVSVTQAGVACTIDLTPTSITLTGAGTSSSVGVAAGSGCVWAASSNVGWLTVTSGAQGNGNGSVGYTVAPNTTAFTRVGLLSIGGRGFTVTQAGSACNAFLSSNSVSIGPAAAIVPVGVSATDECAWSASSTVPWIAIAGGASGTGSGSVSVSVAQHTGSSLRTGVISIAGKSFTVYQSGGCDYSVSPTSVSVGGGSSTAGTWVNTGAGCPWTAQSPVPWVSVSTASGSGTALVNLSVAANSSTSPRSATLTIGGNAVVVQQAGAACNYIVSPVSMNVTGGDHAIDVIAPAGCSWNATSNVPWMTISSGASGSGNGSVIVHLDTNTGPWTRFGFVNLAGWRIFVQQRVTSAPGAPSGFRIVGQPQ